MKIAAMICDYSPVVHVGGDAHRQTVIIDIPNETLPQRLQKLLRVKNPYETLNFSLVIEEPTEKGDEK